MTTNRLHLSFLRSRFHMCVTNGQICDSSKLATKLETRPPTRGPIFGVSAETTFSAAAFLEKINKQVQTSHHCGNLKTKGSFMTSAVSSTSLSPTEVARDWR